VTVYLNREKFDLLVARAGLTNAEFADEARISPVTLSHARNGRVCDLPPCAASRSA
jgi:hypothetical protein